MTVNIDGVAIHPSAIVEEGAKIGPGCHIGPFCHVSRDVVLGANCDLKSHVVIAGETTIGDNAKVFPFASVGHDPQDMKYNGECVQLTIGNNCIIREGVTINPGTGADKGKTTIGDHCVFLANSHVAHDCQLGNGIIFSNNVMLAGHCHVDDNVIIGGGAGVHQFCRIGRNAFIGGLAGVENDVIPYGVALGNRAYLGGLNVIGMKRAGIERASIHAARNLFKFVFSSSGSIGDIIQNIPADIVDDPIAKSIVNFIQEGSGRALCTPARNGK